MYSSDILLWQEKDGWIIETFDYRNVMINCLKLHISKQIPFKLVEDTFLNSELMHHKKKQEK